MNKMLTALGARAKEPSTMAGLAVIGLGVERFAAGHMWPGVALVVAGLLAVVLGERSAS